MSIIIETYDMAGRLRTVRPEDVPTCKLFFPCEEQSGEVIKDVVQGAVWSPNDEPNGKGRLTFDPSIKAIVPEMNADPFGTNGEADPTLLREGTLPDIPAKAGFLYLAVGRVNCYEVPESFQARYARVALGDQNGRVDPTYTHGLGLSNGPFHFAVTDISDNTTRHAQVTDLGYGNSINYTNTGEDIYWWAQLRFNGAVAEAYNAAHRISDDTQMFYADSVTSNNYREACSLSLVPYIRVQGMKLYGVALFVFEAQAPYPADLQRGIRWMAKAWKRGDRSIYPGAVNWR